MTDTAPLTMTRAAAHEPGRIAVIVTRQIGDVLLTTPLLAAARARWPAATIDVLGMDGTLGILAGHAAVTTCVDIGATRTWRQRVALLRKLWRRYDLALVAEASDRAHLLGFVAAPVRSGLVPQTKMHAWWKRLLLDHAVTVAGRPDRHIAAEKTALLAPWLDAAPAPLVTAPAEAPLPADLERLLRAVFVVVHVPSMWRYKQWPVAHYRQVVESLLADGQQVVLTGSAAEADRTSVASLLSAGSALQVVDACGRLDFRQLTNLLGRAALYIGPDTSVTHLAAATGVPVLALFGPTDPTRWGPLGTDPGAAPYVRIDIAPQRRGNVVLLQGSGACVPCGRAGCDDHRASASNCLEGILPERVLAEARRLLASRSDVASAG